MFKRLHRDSLFVGVKKTVLNFSITLESEYNETFVSARIVNILKDMMLSDLLTGMSTLSYYQNIQISMMLIKQEGVLACVESLNSQDAGSQVWTLPFEWCLVLHSNHGEAADSQQSSKLLRREANEPCLLPRAYILRQCKDVSG